ncbi:Mitochondrial distribution and morphology protein 12, partial [Coemansia guatemalensis]
MDLRHYVRIKRVPGARPSDSQYIAGIVFTKNLAHRLMPRFLRSPRIMLLTLPLEYAGPGSRYVAFDEGLRLQRGYTEKLIQRITRAAPDLVLADKPVPRQVLEGLMRSRIAVAHSVKRSVIRAVARCTGAEIVTSMDRFSDYPRAGTCDSLAVQTYEHPSLPEFRKSFIFLDGCIEHLGGTIVLRGDSFEKLGEIKQVVDLVVCLSYSMFLETSLLLDEYALAAPGKYELEWSDSMAYDDARMRPAEDMSLALQALSEYNVVLSSSPCVRIPPPHVLVCMREKELAIRAISDKFDKMSSTRKDAAFSDSTGGNSSAVASTGVSFLVSRQQSAASSNRMRQQYESELALHETYLHEGRMFLQANPHAVSLWDYQSIVVAYMVTCRKHDYCLCAGPQCHLIPFYTGSDATLGQYLEICFDLTSICPSGSRRCTHPMYEHRHSYIHNHGRVNVTMDEYPCPIARLSEVLLMWSECTRCHKHTPV